MSEQFCDSSLSSVVLCGCIGCVVFSFACLIYLPIIHINITQKPDVSYLICTHFKMIFTLKCMAFLGLNVVDMAFKQRFWNLKIFLSLKQYYFAFVITTITDIFTPFDSFIFFILELPNKCGKSFPGYLIM